MCAQFIDSWNSAPNQKPVAKNKRYTRSRKLHLESKPKELYFEISEFIKDIK